MKNKDNNRYILSVAIILGCIILGGFIFSSQINKKNSIEKQSQLKNQIDCQEKGNKLYSSIIKEDNLSHYFSPEFKFNIESDLCLMQLTHQNFNNTAEVNDIINVYQNKVIMRYGQRLINDKWEDYLGTKEQWDSKIKELF